MPPCCRRLRQALSRPHGVLLRAAFAAVILYPTLARGGDSTPVLEGNVVRDAFQIVPEPNGKLVAVGEQPANGSALKLVRFQADGRIDHGFNASTLGLLALDSIARLANGKFLLAGRFADAAGNPSRRLVKLNADGSFDPGFQPGSAFAAAPLVQSDGRILLLEMVETEEGVLQPKLTRLHRDGRRDVSFQPGVRLLRGGDYRLRMQPDGDLLLIGKDGASIGQPSLQRLKSDGPLDQTFRAADPVANGYGVCALAQTPDGKLLVAEYSDAARSVCTLHRLTSEGALDPDFLAPAALGAPIYEIVVDQAGRIIFDGAFSQVNGIARPGFARLHSDGRLDTSFDPLSDPSPSFDGFVASQTGTVTFARALTAAENAGLPDGPGVLLEQYGAGGSAVSVVKIPACPACELVPANQGLVYVRVENPPPVASAATAYASAP